MTFDADVGFQKRDLALTFDADVCALLFRNEDDVRYLLAVAPGFPHSNRDLGSTYLSTSPIYLSPSIRLTCVCLPSLRQPATHHSLLLPQPALESNQLRLWYPVPVGLLLTEGNLGKAN